MRTLKKILSFALVFALLLGLGPVFTERAEAATGAWDGTVDVSWYNPDESVYYINTPAQLAGLAALVNGMADPKCPKVIGDASYIKSVTRPNISLVGAGGGNVSATVYGSDTDFAYKTVYLTADLDMGGVFKNGAWTGPNWTPVGGKFPMKPEVTDGDCIVTDTRFNGVLDGQGHTVSNIYCDRYAAKGFPYSMAVGLVGFLGGLPDNETSGGHSAGEKVFENGWRPTVKNVVLGKGYIYARRMVGGIVGRVGETSNGIVVENCANFADVRNTDSKGIGGIVGTGWGTGVIRNCYNAGSVTTTFACPAGGICGSNQGLNIYNCYNIGKIDSNGNTRGRGIGGHDTGSYAVTNCYYLEGSDDDPASGGWYKGTTRNVTVDIKALSAQDMKTQGFIDNLNASGTVFAPDSGNINQGYPVFFFQAAGAAAAKEFNVRAQQPTEGGTFSAERTGVVAAGQTVTLSAKPAVGWALRHYTLNGKPLGADFFTVSEDSAVSAVFYKVGIVRVNIPQSQDSYLSFSRIGYEPAEGGEARYVTRKPLANGDLLMEKNIVYVKAVPYPGATPAEAGSQFTGSYEITATNAEKNTDGTFTVTGAGDVTFTVSQSVGKKSWSSAADTSWYTGPNKTYTLTSAEQLSGMAKLVNTDGIDFTGSTIRLGSDISLGGNDGGGGRIWEACGRNVSKRFSGTFDGGGYNIYDMTAYSSGSYAGLFGYCVGAVIKNVTVRGTVTGEADTAYASGIVAYASASVIENCTNRASIIASGTGAGGVASYICDGTSVTNCVNRATVSGTSGVGGIVGVCYSSEDVITNCRNHGEIKAIGDNSYGSGGVVGQLAGDMTGCGNFAPVTSADRYTGGLAGYTTSRLNSNITNSVNTGTVSSSCANQTAAVGSAVGYAQYLSLDNVSAAGAVSAAKTFTSPDKGGLLGREGTVTQGNTINAGLLPSAPADSDAWQPPQEKQGSRTVTFMADGKTIETVAYSNPSQKISEPAVPAKPGHSASWSGYKLNGADVLVQAVYRPVFIKGGAAIDKSGTYYLDPGSGGQITIAAGLSVTLDGTYGACEELSVVAGKGVNLTLNNLTLKGAKTLLTMDGGTLSLIGDNAILNTSDTAGNTTPSVSIAGSGIIKGPGSLYVTAVDGNSSVKLSAGAILELQSGTLSLFKDGLLPEGGGALYADAAAVVISGGDFNGYTNSDNIPVISAQTIKITGGTVRAQATKSPVVIDGKTVTVTGGTVYCAGHTGNSHATVQAYSGVQAIKGISGAAGGKFETALPFGSSENTAETFKANISNP